MNQPEPEIVAAATEMGVGPQDLRDLLDAGARQPLAAPDEPDDLPKLLAGLDEQGATR